MDTTYRKVIMHTLHWLSVEAENADEAVTNVDHILESYMGSGDSPNTWYDWYVVGGGRWNTAENDDLDEAYKMKSNMVISLADDPNGFYAKIQECIQTRVDDYQKYLAEVKEYNVLEKLENYGGVMSYDPMFYSLNALLRYQTGEWSHDSWFFDLVHDSTNAGHILAKINSNEAQNLFLVPVDFHF